jgi:hypothetical protein
LEASLDTFEHELWRDDRAFACALLREQLESFRPEIVKALEGSEIRPTATIVSIKVITSSEIKRVITPLPAGRGNRPFLMSADVEVVVEAEVRYVSPPNLSVYAAQHSEQLWKEAQDFGTLESWTLRCLVEVEGFAHPSGDPVGPYRRFDFLSAKLIGASPIADNR